MSDGVTDNRAESRYEYREGGALAVAAYERENDVVVFTHTMVPEALRGRGIASRLIAAALADVLKRGLKVRAECAFVVAYLKRHPEARELIAD